jgi:hypothetical protein
MLLEGPLYMPEASFGAISIPIHIYFWNRWEQGKGKLSYKKYHVTVF